MIREEFTDQYGLVGIKTPEALGSYPQDSIPGIFSNRISKPVNPTSLLDGDVVTQLNFLGTNLISSNFRALFKSNNTTFYLSDGTTPNGNLVGEVGDICFNGASGKAYNCTGTNNWSAFN